ncbi:MULTISPECIES: hypothetical protein [Flavobacterium]|uniref:Uncharacterized protein n=1 Tax=Flavobacterium anhuiense TaxID=459526 RepID=A0A444VWZ7_9FLAO|nr:hypothetical protein [Flavobacterium anhuiense]RYJ38058.1 hypothetical protein NU08_2961 [Flavobacterium anhuiense]
MAIIRKNPLFEIYFEDGHLIINNADYKKDNRAIDIENIQSLELIRNLSFLNKIIEVTFGLNFPAKSCELRINMENGFKDIILTDCDINQVETLIYEINQIINKI